MQDKKSACEEQGTCPRQGTAGSGAVGLGGGGLSQALRGERRPLGWLPGARS